MKPEMRGDSVHENTVAPFGESEAAVNERTTAEIRRRVAGGVELGRHQNASSTIWNAVSGQIDEDLADGQSS